MTESEKPSAIIFGAFTCCLANHAVLILSFVIAAIVRDTAAFRWSKYMVAEHRVLPRAIRWRTPRFCEPTSPSRLSAAIDQAY